MCEGFGLIVTKDGRYLWCEPDRNGNCSHTEILKRAGIKENKDVHKRSFVRTQFSDWKAESFEFDENGTLPAWVDEVIVKENCVKLLDRVYLFWAEYEKVVDTAWAEYLTVKATAWSEYKKLKANAMAEYLTVTATAWAEYNKVVDPAMAEFIDNIKSITGYLGK
jgi:hypothetical protein